MALLINLNRILNQTKNVLLLILRLVPRRLTHPTLNVWLVKLLKRRLRNHKDQLPMEGLCTYRVNTTGVGRKRMYRREMTGMQQSRNLPVRIMRLIDEEIEKIHKSKLLLFEK